MADFVISVLDSGPSLTHTKIPFSGPYTSAVAMAHTIHRNTGRTTYVLAAKSTHWLHMATKGTATDRNTGSGVPVTQAVA